MLPDYAQLQHAFAWVIENDLNLAWGLSNSIANLQAQFGFARENLDWTKRVVEKARQAGDEGAIPATLGNYANALSRVANLPGEDRAARLRESLAAYDEALRFWTPDTAPLDYATTQNNRGNRLGNLANLPGEDRTVRLRESLAAYEEALRFWTPRHRTARLRHDAK